VAMANPLGAERVVGEIAEDRANLTTIQGYIR
jgi:hypothetical protein